MVAVRLDENALDYVTAALNDAGGLAALLPRYGLGEPVVFVPEIADPEIVEDLESGGIANQPESDAELALYLHLLKKRNGRLHSLIFDDPWSKPGDLDYAGPPPEEVAIIGGRVNYIYDLAALAQDLIWQYRANAISFLRLVYVSELTVERIRDLTEDGPDNLLPILARSIRHVAVNAHDDETWVIAGVGTAER